MMRRTRLPILVTLAVVTLSGCIYVDAGLGRDIEEVVVAESDRLFEVNRIAVIDVDGFIASGEPWLFFAGTSVADVKERLQRAENDWRVKAVVLRINSPGGEATASDVIHREVLRFKKESGKPVVAALMSTAASGGYYVACAADHIIASPTCVTGSVGVVMNFYNVEGLYNKIGLETVVIKSGEKKDIANPARPMTDEERAILEGLNRTLYDRFVAAVRDGRPGMTEQDFEAIADGRPVSAPEAQRLHMVDSIGYLDDAIEQAVALAEVPDADVVMYQSERSQTTNIYTEPAAVAQLMQEGLGILLRRSGPNFLYLWMPER